MTFTWVLHDAGGGILRTSETFPSKDEAEAWMGSEWSTLLAEGAESVSLMDGERSLYKMSLRES